MYQILGLMVDARMTPGLPGDIKYQAHPQTCDSWVGSSHLMDKLPHRKFRWNISRQEATAFKYDRYLICSKACLALSLLSLPVFLGTCLCICNAAALKSSGEWVRHDIASMSHCSGL